MINRAAFQALLWCVLAPMGLPMLAPAAHAQQAQSAHPATAAPPAASSTAPAQTATQDNQKSPSTDADPANPKNDRIFMVIPNYTTVEKPPVTYTPLTIRQKFVMGAEDAFDPYSFPLAGALAAIAQAENEDPAWGQGWKGYGKRYAAGFGDATIGSFMTTGVFPSLLHEDPRYFRLGTGGFWTRSGHAMERMFVTTTDSDHSQFNYSEWVGNAAAAGISLTYHSRQERTFSTFAGNWGTQLAIDVIANQLKEFWPDIRHKLFKKSLAT